MSVKIEAYDSSNNSTLFTFELPVGSGEAYVDTTAPTTQIVSPQNNSAVSGVVNITTDVSDDFGVTKAELYVDGALLKTVTSTPYNFSWDTSSITLGSHILKVKAYDDVGNIGESLDTTVIVESALQTPTATPTSGQGKGGKGKPGGGGSSPTPTITSSPANSDTQAPVVTITSPLDNQTVGRGSTVTVVMNASDNEGVVKVDLTIDKDSNTVCTATATPFSCDWSVPNKPNTQYILKAIAYDAAGNLGRSGLIFVNSN